MKKIIIMKYFCGLCGCGRPAQKKEKIFFILMKMKNSKAKPAVVLGLDVY